MSELQDKNTFEPSLKDRKVKWNKASQEYLDKYMREMDKLTDTQKLKHLEVGFKTLFVIKEVEKFDQRERDNAAVFALSTELEEMAEKLKEAEEKCRKLQAPKG